MTTDATEARSRLARQALPLLAAALFALGCGDKKGEEKAQQNAAQRAAGGRPNVVVVLIDTLRPDYLGFYGFERETAPFLASLADRWVVFENAYSGSSWTAPSTASLFTSLYPPQHGVTQGVWAHRSAVAEAQKNGGVTVTLNAMPKSVRTLPERMRSAGYRTYGFASNINIGEEIGFSRGFDVFEKEDNAPVDRFLEKLRDRRDEIAGGEGPYFLYLHLNDAHSPYDIHEAYYRGATGAREGAAERYRSEIGFLDANLKEIFALLGDGDDTAYVILSDHGEEFWDHGGTRHSAQLFRELHHILLMMGAPGGKPGRVAENTSIIDVFPTLMDLLGEKAPEPTEGISLAPLLSDPGGQGLRARLAERTLFGHREPASQRKSIVWAAVYDRWRLVDRVGDPPMLYDEREDPADAFDLAAKRPEVLGELKGRLDAFKKRMEREAPEANGAEFPLDDALLERLSAMGYVD